MSGMISYSIEGNARRTAAISCAAISLIVAILLNSAVMPSFGTWLSSVLPNGAIATFAAVGISSAISFLALDNLLSWLFDIWIWKWPMFIKMHHVLDLNGVWVGQSSSEPYGSQGMSMTIVQTFSKMSCDSEFPSSFSSATVIGIFACDPGRRVCELQFAYENRVRGVDALSDEKRDNEHKGFNVLTVRGDRMEGPYFTFRNKQTKGYIELERKGE